MDKNILAQYIDLKKEIIEIGKRIETLRRQKERMGEEGYTERDIVKGGMGGTQHFIVEGFPQIAYSKIKTKLLSQELRLESMQIEYISMTDDVEEYIGAIPDSQLRRIFRLRYISGCSWASVAIKIGGGNTEDAVRKSHDRWLQKN